MNRLKGTLSLALFVLLAAFALPATASAKPKVSGTYAGTTSEGLPVSFKISKSNKVKDLSIGLGPAILQCQGGVLDPTGLSYPTVRLQDSSKGPGFAFRKTWSFFPPGAGGFNQSWEVLADINVRGFLKKKLKFRGEVFVFFKWADPRGLISTCGETQGVNAIGEEHGTSEITWTARKK